MAFFEDVYRTAAELAAENPVIPLGDIWIEKDSGKAKRGDGSSRWNDLSYWDPGGIGSGGGAVDSVNGQTGAVVLDAEDVGAEPEGAVAAAVEDLDPDTLVRDDDPRLSDARTPTSHTHSAGQVTGLATVATSGSYSDLAGTPSLGTAAAANTGDFATAAQGSLANTAVQPADLDDLPTTFWHVYTSADEARDGSATVEVWIPNDPALDDPDNAEEGDVVLRTTPGVASVHVHDGTSYEAAGGRIFIGPEPSGVSPAAGDIWYDPDNALQYVYWGSEWVAISGGDPPEPTAPGTVTGLVATAGDGQVSLSWSAPSTGGSPITDYVIERADDDNEAPGAWGTLTDGTSTATSYLDTDVTNNSTYWYRVSAVNAIGTGTASTPASATPAAGLSGVLEVVVDSFDSTNQPTVTFNDPLLEGDLVVIFATTETNTDIWSSFDTGTATLVTSIVKPTNNSVTATAYYHWVTSAEESGETVTFGQRLFETTEAGNVWGVALRGVDESTPVDQFDTTSGNTLPFVLPGLDDSIATGAYVFCVLGVDLAPTLGAPSGGDWELIEAGVNTNTAGGLYGLSTPPTNGVAVTAGSVSTDNPDDYAAITVAFRPA